MRKHALIICALAFLAIGATAGMDSKPFSITTPAGETNSSTLAVRGELEGIYIDVAASSTQTVTVASDQQTLYTKAAITADVWVPLRYVQYDGSGVVLTSGTTSNSVYGKAPLAGDITVTIIDASGAEKTTAVSVLYLR